MKRKRSLMWVASALLVTVVVGWLSAQSDDRPPIIVSDGSVYFTNGDASSPIMPTQWTDDIVLSEWKPADNNYKGISGFAVSFENSYAASPPAVCADASAIPPAPVKTALLGDEVKIEYTQGGGKGKINFVVRRRRNHLLGLFGKNEPKVANPSGTGQKLTLPSSTQLRFDDQDGYISMVTVGSANCQFQAPDSTQRQTFRVRIQPKAEQ